MTRRKAVNGPIPEPQRGIELGPICGLTRDQMRRLTAHALDRLGDTDETRDIIAALVHPPRFTPDGHSKRTHEFIVRYDERRRAEQAAALQDAA